ncbi:MAG: MFS transporter [Beijerinckiaceae bacterium]|jgi:predicted MFS family arabinose efflux permease|nr:MFS transporter [Beijerinckiaceae bacterium]
MKNSLKTSHLYPLLLGIGFSSSLALRSLDPLTVSIANDLSVAPVNVALLGTALSITYAMSNPVLGPTGDHFGKGRLITIALWLITISVFASAFAPTFAVLVIMRAITGLAAGGIVPIGQAMIGDMYRADQRQIAIARSTMVVFLGQLLGASLAGIADAHIGWRGVLIACGVITGIAAIAATWKMPKTRPPVKAPFRPKTILNNYLVIFRMPRAWVCYGTGFIQSGIMFGLMPFIALILEKLNLGGAREAGFIIGGFSAGSLLFALSIPITLRLLSRPNLLVAGAIISAIGLTCVSYGVAWYWQVAIFAITGFGYFLQHNAIQGEVADLSDDLRASAYSMHAFSFFMGSAAAPVIYSFTFSWYGVRPTLICAAIIFLIVGLTSSAVFRWLRRKGL